MTASIRDTLTCSNAVCAGWRSYKSNSGLILLIFHILFHFTLWLQMTEARLCTYVSVCRRFSGYCRRDAILPGASFSFALFNTFPSFSLFWPGSFQEQLITTTNVYGNPQLAKYPPAFGWHTRSSFCYGTRHTCISVPCVNSILGLVSLKSWHSDLPQTGSFMPNHTFPPLSLISHDGSVYKSWSLTFLPSYCDLLHAEKGAMLVWVSLDDDFACILLLLDWVILTSFLCFSVHGLWRLMYWVINSHFFFKFTISEIWSQVW